MLQQAECSKQFRDGGSFQQLIEAGLGCACDENYSVSLPRHHEITTKLCTRDACLCDFPHKIPSGAFIRGVGPGCD